MIRRRMRAVFPTPVGMNQLNINQGKFWSRVPHARGDEPVEILNARLTLLCSPRPWG